MRRERFKLHINTKIKQMLIFNKFKNIIKRIPSVELAIAKYSNEFESSDEGVYIFNSQGEIDTNGYSLFLNSQAPTKGSKNETDKTIFEIVVNDYSLAIEDKISEK